MAVGWPPLPMLLPNVSEPHVAPKPCRAWWHRFLASAQLSQLHLHLQFLLSIHPPSVKPLLLLLSSIRRLNPSPWLSMWHLSIFSGLTAQLQIFTWLLPNLMSVRNGLTCNLSDWILHSSDIFMTLQYSLFNVYNYILLILHSLQLVFSSPVKSSFSHQNEATGNHNRSRLCQIFRDRNRTLKDRS